jgi:drug/metabolite transporter (DMT)-like permease
VDRLRSYAALILATAAWGVEFTVAKYAVEGLGGFTTLFIESATAAAVLWAVMLRKRVPRAVPLRNYVVLGLVEPFLLYSALNVGLRLTKAADASLLVALLPVMVLVLSVIFIRERVGLRSLLAVLLVTAHVSASVGLGDALVLVACLASAASVLMVNRLTARAATLEITAYQFGFGFLFTIPVIAVVWATGYEAVPGTAQLPQVAAAVGIGVVAFALAYAAYNYAVGRVAVNTAGIALNLIPFFGVASAVLLLRERLTGIEWIAGGVIIAGLAIFPHNAEIPATTHQPVQPAKESASCLAPTSRSTKPGLGPL